MVEFSLPIAPILDHIGTVVALNDIFLVQSLIDSIQDVLYSLICCAERKFYLYAFYSVNEKVDLDFSHPEGEFNFWW